jgi:hypothetical protein
MEDDLDVCELTGDEESCCPTCRGSGEFPCEGARCPDCCGRGTC